MRRVDEREREQPLRVKEGRVPREGAAPVVPDDVRAGFLLALAKPCNEARKIVEERLDAVRSDARGLVREVVAAQVGRHGAEARSRERGDLVTPRVPELGEAVEEDDERSLTLFDPVEPDPVHAALAVRPRFRHAASRRGSLTREKRNAETNPKASMTSHSARPPALSSSAMPTGGPATKARLNAIV
jgi:hypothetical protein